MILERLIQKRKKLNDQLLNQSSVSTAKGKQIQRELKQLANKITLVKSQINQRITLKTTLRENTTKLGKLREQVRKLNPKDTAKAAKLLTKVTTLLGKNERIRKNIESLNKKLK